VRSLQDQKFSLSDYKSWTEVIFNLFLNLSKLASHHNRLAQIMSRR